MLLNAMTVTGKSTYGKVIDRTWIVKGPSTSRVPAIEGSDFTLTEDDTKFVMPINQYFTIIMQRQRVREAAGKSLYFRFYLSNTVQVGVWKDGLAFAINLGVGWHTARCDYYANGQNRYVIDGVTRYSGPKREAIDFYWSGPRTFYFDVGDRGGVLPADCEWW